MSARSGTFTRISFSGVSRLAAISGNAAFLAPPIGITPWSGKPPLMRILSIASFHSTSAGAAADSTPSSGASSIVIGAFTGTGGNRSSRRLALPACSLRAGLPILCAFLFLAPHQVLAQRLGEPRLAGSPLLALFRGYGGRLGHPVMQRAHGQAVKR